MKLEFELSAQSLSASADFSPRRTEFHVSKIVLRGQANICSIVSGISRLYC